MTYNIKSFIIWFLILLLISYPALPTDISFVLVMPHMFYAALTHAFSTTIPPHVFTHLFRTDSFQGAWVAQSSCMLDSWFQLRSCMISRFVSLSSMSSSALTAWSLFGILSLCSSPAHAPTHSLSLKINGQT